MKNNKKILIPLLFFVICFSIKAEAATSIYRSAAPQATAALSTTTASNITLSISGDTATFSGAQPANIGVGDAIQYDSDNNGSIDAIVFIHGRTSSTVYTVKNAAGTNSTSTSASDTDWSVFRAYTSLANAETGTENTSIDDAVENFDTWSGGKALTTSDEQWNIALYANGTTGDGAVSIDGWTSDSTRYLKVYTPTAVSEVGVSQRHVGVWDDGKYKIEMITGQSVNIADNHVRLTGVQIYMSATASTQVLVSLNSSVDGAHISSNIIRSATHPVSGSITAISIANNSGSSIYIYNNIIYNLATASTGAARGINDTSSSGSYVYVYNNTIHTCTSSTGATTAVSVGAFGRSVAKNNIIKNCAQGITGTYAAGSDYNATDAASFTYTVTGGGNTHDRLSQTFSFVDESNKNFHLLSSDAGARDVGVDLSADGNLPFTTDIDGEPRGAGSGWDIGADEYQAPDTVPPTRSNGIPTGEQVYGTTQVILSVDTDENATCKYGTTANTAYASIVNTFSGTGGLAHTQTLTGLSNGTSYTYYVRCSDTATNANIDDYSISFSIASTDSTPPAVSVTSPSNNSYASSTVIALVATSTDANGVAGVQFKLDTNTLIGSEDTSGPYTVNWDPGVVSEGVHTVIAVARDSAGNYATSTAITITVDRTGTIVDLVGPVSTTTAYGYNRIQFTNSNPTNPQCSVDNTTWVSCVNDETYLSHLTGWSSITTGNTFNVYMRDIDPAGNGTIDVATGLTKGVVHMPKGIPDPGMWGSTHPIYSTAPSTPGSWPSDDTAGYYYIDKLHPQATDTVGAGDLTDGTGKRYGYPDKPRLTFPESAVDAGAYIEIHNGPYEVFSGDAEIDLDFSNCTAVNVCWLRGPSPQDKAEFTGTVELGGKYAILENLEFNYGTTSDRHSLGVGGDAEHADHISIRDVTMTGDGQFHNGFSSVSGIKGTSGNETTDIIYHQVIIKYADDLEYARTVAEDDNHAIVPGQYTERVWVLNSHLHNNSGDGMQISGNNSFGEARSRYVYIGRNEINANAENAVDIKSSLDVIISENKIYDYLDSGGSDGTAVVVQQEGGEGSDNIWILYNDFYNTRKAVRGEELVSNVNVIGNVLHDNWFDTGVITNCSYGGSMMYFRTDGAQANIVDNTFYNHKAGIGWDNEPTVIMSGNIFSNRSNQDSFDICADTNVSSSTVNHTLFDDNSQFRIMWSNVPYTSLSSFQSAKSMCANCVFGDVDFVNPPTDFNLQSSSAARDANVESSVYSAFESRYGLNIRLDYASTTRPQDGLWDIGAYEYVSGAPDTTPPNRSNGLPTGSLSSGTTATTLQLNTHESATCKYGTVSGTAYASIASTFSTTGGTTHTQSLTGLTDGTSYTYYVRCIDGLLNANATDYTISFSVAAAGDSTQPTASITLPANAATVSGASVAITASASDNVGVAGVQFKYNTNNNIGAEDTTSSYGVSWDTTGLSNGSYTLIAVARDAAGNYATSSPVTVTVDNTVSNTTPPTTTTSGGGGGGGGGSVTVIYPNQATSTASTTASTARVYVPGCPAGFVCVPTNQNIIPNTSNPLATVFPRDLKLNMKGVDVQELQRFLNRQGFLIARVGVGSKGKETTLFGPATRAALIKFQRYYKISPAVGYFGPATKAFINKRFRVQ